MREVHRLSNVHQSALRKNEVKLCIPDFFCRYVQKKRPEVSEVIGTEIDCGGERVSPYGRDQSDPEFLVEDEEPEETPRKESFSPKSRAKDPKFSPVSSSLDRISTSHGSRKKRNRPHTTSTASSYQIPPDRSISSRERGRKLNVERALISEVNSDLLIR